MSIKKNYIYNLSYQILSIITPLITTPYITRIFTTNDLGINAVTAANTQYFILLASLGVSLYGSRQIASTRSMQSYLDKSFWSIFFIKLFTTLISIILFIITVFILFNENKMFYLVQALNIVSVGIDISWLFIGMEQFGKIVLRNAIVKVIGIILLFICIKTSDDLLKYIFILASTNFLGLLVLWVHVPKYIRSFYFEPTRILGQLKPLLKLFVPQMITMIYVVLDKTMLGALSGDSQAGIYDMSQKIITVLQTIITSLATVMIPRIAYLISQNDTRKIRYYMEKSYLYLSYISFPIVFGICSVSKEFSLIFFGKEFNSISIILSLNSWVLIATSWGYLVGLQYLVPTNRERELTISYIIGAIVNFSLNLVLIQNYHAMGAVISTIITEFLITFTQFYLVRKELELHRLMYKLIPNFISCCLMYSIVTCITMNNNFSTVVVRSLMGIFIYILSMFIFKSSVQQEIIKLILNKLMIKKQYFNR